MCYFHSDKKSWKIFVILFGGIKNSPYLCRRFSGARQFESKLSFALACKTLHPATRPAERLHRGPATGIPTTGARDKQIAASVLSYHRQGPLLREGKRGPRERRGRVREEPRERREGGTDRERREKNNFHHL